MNQQNARRIAVTNWLNLTRHFPNNMLGLTQYASYYDVRFYAKFRKPDKEEVIDKIACLHSDNVRLRTHTYNDNEDWQLHIEIGFEFESTTK